MTVVAMMNIELISNSTCDRLRSLHRIKVKLNDATRRTHFPHLMIQMHEKLAGMSSIDFLDGFSVNFALGSCSSQRKEKQFHPIHYASKAMTEGINSLQTTKLKKEMQAVVYALGEVLDPSILSGPNKLDDVLFPLPKVDILPIEVEPVEVMFNDSHTYGENISQVEREFLSMVDELLNLSNDDETFDPGGGENDVLLNNGENNDLNVFTIRTFLPFVTYPEVLPASYSTGSEDKVFKPGIFDDELERKSSLTLDTFIPPDPPFIHHSSLVWGNIRLTGVLHPHFYTP
ncbi:hypothetical protein Tco_0519816 [Tanacetum coccineum]